MANSKCVMYQGHSCGGLGKLPKTNWTKREMPPQSCAFFQPGGHVNIQRDKKRRSTWHILSWQAPIQLPLQQFWDPTCDFLSLDSGHMMSENDLPRWASLTNTIFSSYLCLSQSTDNVTLWCAQITLYLIICAIYAVPNAAFLVNCVWASCTSRHKKSIFDWRQYDNGNAYFISILHMDMHACAPCVPTMSQIPGGSVGALRDPINIVGAADLIIQVIVTAE